MATLRATRPSLRAALAATRPRAARPAGAFFSTAARRGALADPVDIPAWVAANRHMLQPPINNFCLTDDPQTVMVVGGPNARTDYHINETPEFFFQHRGSMLLRTVETPAAGAGAPRFRDIPIHEGCLYLLPAGVPHNPVRFADTVGIVIEQPRPAGAIDRLRWYCQGCGAQVHEAAFPCTDLGTQLKDAVQAFEADTAARTCKGCGTVCDVRPADVEALRPKRDP